MSDNLYHVTIHFTLKGHHLFYWVAGDTLKILFYMTHIRKCVDAETIKCPLYICGNNLISVITFECSLFEQYTWYNLFLILVIYIYHTNCPSCR